ncbi:MAG TPA: hypothetical protein DCW31_09060 [Lactobacillus sp.]|nr:hypothetical protein [Lactobacillus sp.]
MSLSTKIKLFSALGLAVAGLGLSVPSVAMAQTSTPSTTSTQATVGFTEDDQTPENPVDPENPTKPGDGTNPGTGNTGALTLDYVSGFDFGINKISPSEKTYTAGLDKANKSTTYAQVTDKRAGDPKGWTLKVTEQEQLKSLKAQKELTGTQISLTEAKAVSGLSLPESQVSVTDQALTPGTQSVVMNALPGNGYGRWTDAWGTAKTGSGVKLTVPTGAYPEADTYTTNLNWSLEDIPTNGGSSVNPNLPTGN